MKVMVNSVVHMASAPRIASASGKSGAGKHSVVLALEFPDPNRHNVIELLFCDFFGIVMSAIGTKQTSACALHMSAFDPKRTSLVRALTGRATRKIRC